MTRTMDTEIRCRGCAVAAETAEAVAAEVAELAEGSLTKDVAVAAMPGDYLGAWTMR